MTIWASVAIQNVACIAAGVYLITHDCPWWALLCFACIKYVRTEKEADQ